MSKVRREGMASVATLRRNATSVDEEALLEMMRVAFQRMGSPMELRRARDRVARLAAYLEEALATIAGESRRLTWSATPFPGEGRSRHRLSPREVEIAAAIATGTSVKETAAKFGISGHTVRNHLKSIFRKLGVHSSIEMINVAVKAKLISL